MPVGVSGVGSVTITPILSEKAEAFVATVTKQMFESGRLIQELETVKPLKHERLQQESERVAKRRKECGPQELAILELFNRRIQTQAVQYFRKFFSENPTFIKKCSSSEVNQKINLVIERYLLQDIRGIAREFEKQDSAPFDALVADQMTQRFLQILPSLGPDFAKSVNGGEVELVRAALDSLATPDQTPEIAALIKHFRELSPNQQDLVVRQVVAKIRPQEPATSVSEVLSEQALPAIFDGKEEAKITGFLDRIVQNEGEKFMLQWGDIVHSASMDVSEVVRRKSALESMKAHEAIFRNLTMLIFVKRYQEIHHELASVSFSGKEDEFSELCMDSAAYLWLQILSEDVTIKKRDGNTSTQSKISALPNALKSFSELYPLYLCMSLDKVTKQYEALINLHDPQIWSRDQLIGLQAILPFIDTEAYRAFFRDHAHGNPHITDLREILKAPVAGFVDSAKSIVAEQLSQSVELKGNPGVGKEIQDQMRGNIKKLYMQFLVPGSIEFETAKLEIETFKQESDARRVALLEVLKRQVFTKCQQECAPLLKTVEFLSEEEKAHPDFQEFSQIALNVAIEFGILQVLRTYTNILH